MVDLAAPIRGKSQLHRFPAWVRMGPRRLAALRPIRCLRSPAFLGLSREHRPSSTEWGEILAKDRRSPPSQTWRTFLTNHVRDLVAVDFFRLPTARLRVLFVFVVLAHHRRRVLHLNVTKHPTAAWTAQQLVDIFPDDSAPPIFSATATPSTGRHSANESRVWGSMKS